MTGVESSKEDLATQLDQHSDYFRENVYDIYKQLRTQCPMVHSEKWGGFWAFLDYQDVYDAEQVAEIFSSGAGKEVPGVEGSLPFIPIDYDPPLVQDYRKIALPFFSPGAAKALEPTFRRLATELIDEFIESGEADIIGQLTTPLPARWILQMLGFDESRLAGMGGADPRPGARAGPRPGEERGGRGPDLHQHHHRDSEAAHRELRRRPAEHG